MSETHPDDAVLLALSEDEATGVEYIPTGKSPYYLDFRRMLYRLLRVAERANDLRVYAEGDLTLGVRPGRAHVGGNAVDFGGATEVIVEAEATVHVWLDTAGEIQTGTDGLPADRSSFVPLAEVVTGASAIESITDLRGEAFLAIPGLAMLNVAATAEEINQALDGIDASVTADALSTVTAGGMTSADVYHRHLTLPQNEDEEVSFRIINHSSHDDANAALQLSLPQMSSWDSFLVINRDNGFLQQRYANTAYNLVGVVQPQYAHAGELTATLTDILLGCVPAAGRVTDVILSIGANIESDDDDDGIAATLYVNGSAVTSTSPELVAADGAGFVSTDQDDGTPATIVDNGTEQVRRGDILTLDLQRTVNGNVSHEATNVAVLVVIRVDAPE